MRKLAPNMLWVCIDTCNSMKIAGSMFSVMKKEKIVFEDFDKMILRADAIFDETGYPQSFQQKRSMKEHDRIRYARLQMEPLWRTEDIMKYEGTYHTFVILVNSRQFANWQGTVFTKDFRVLGEFKDVLDLIHLMIESNES